MWDTSSLVSLSDRWGIEAFPSSRKMLWMRNENTGRDSWLFSFVHFSPSLPVMALLSLPEVSVVFKELPLLLQSFGQRQVVIDV